MRTKRLLSILSVLLLPLAACDRTAETGEVGEGAMTPVRGGSITLIELGDIDKPMPLISTSSLDNELSGVMYMPLLAPRWENGRLLYLTAADDSLALAKSYEFFGPDSASLRYNMRTDVKWSDGQPVTAHDAKWTIDTRGDPRTASPRQEYNRMMKEVVVENDSTLVIHFQRHYPEMFFHSAGDVAPMHIYKDTDPSQLRSHPALTNPAGGALVVSGPYVIGEWLPGERLVLVPNPQYHPAPYIQRIVYRPITEETTRIVELQTRNTDVLYPIPFDKIDVIRQSNPEVRYERRQRRFYDYIAYNPLSHPAFADKEIRKALGMALDIPAMISALHLDEYAEPAGGPYSPLFSLLYDPQGQAPLVHNQAEAIRILESKGWVLGPDSVRVKDGRRLSFSIATNAGNQRRADIGQIAQQAWRRIGVEARFQTFESNTFFDRLQKKEFEAAIAGWGVGLSADIKDQWQGDNVFNYTSYANPEVNRLFEQAAEQRTEEDAAQYWRQAASLIVADQPYTWLFYFDQLAGVNDKIQNTRIDTLGMYQNIHEWWIRGLAADQVVQDGDSGN